MAETAPLIQPRRAVWLCAVLLALFGMMSFSAALNKSPTFDEPVQAMAGWLRLHYSDFRFNFEDPPLWEDFAALPNGIHALKPDWAAQSWQEMAKDQAWQWNFAERMLFHTDGVNGVDVVNRSRFMMLLVGIALGALIALWAWRLAGPVAALASLTLFCLDPNFLGHASLVKNDVCVSLVLLGIMFLTWRIGQGLRWGHAIGFMLACGAASVVKFSTVLIAPMVLILLALRVLSPVPWTVLGRELTSRLHKALAATALIACAAVVIYWSIWTAYGFRFRGTPERGVHLNSEATMTMLRSMQTAYRYGGSFEEGHKHLAEWKPDVPTQVLQYALERKLLPEAWINGFLFIYASSILRTSFLLGESRDTGWWYYFPIAVAVKTPLSTLVALAGAAVAGVWFFRRRERRPDEWWTLACLVIPPVIYFGSAMRASMNIGIRHVLPVYGFAFVACGVVGAASIRQFGRPALYRMGGLAVALAIETFSTAPDFIAFFNAAAGGPRNGIHILGDSNLDWGQDLPLLALWQERHPTTPLYLSYFGTVSPESYGIVARSLYGNYRFSPPFDPTLPITLPSVFAISANHLMGFAVGIQVGDFYAKFRTMKPRAVLGGTIYLFDIPDEATLQSVRPE